MDVLLMLVETDKGDPVMEQVMKGFDNKAVCSSSPRCSQRSQRLLPALCGPPLACCMTLDPRWSMYSRC